MFAFRSRRYAFVFLVVFALSFLASTVVLSSRGKAYAPTLVFDFIFSDRNRARAGQDFSNGRPISQ